MSAFVEQAVRDAAKRRRTQAEFIARGLAGREDARRTGVSFTVHDLDRKLGVMLAEARARVTAAK